MNLQPREIEKKLASIVASVGKDPASWQDWFCLQISLENKSDDEGFQECIARTQMFIEAYLNKTELHFFFCRNQTIHIFCKDTSENILRHAGQQVCDLLFDEEALLTQYEVFDLKKDGFYYVSYALDQADGEASIPVSAYSALDPFVAGPVSKTSPLLNEKSLVNYQDLTKILLVEDDPVTRWMVRKSLKHDCQLVTAPTANQSFDKFLSFQPDIVFLDIDLPDKSGRDVLRWIVRNDPSTCVVMFSSNNNLENISETLEEGASGFIAKPFLRDQLLHYIHAYSR